MPVCAPRRRGRSSRPLAAGVAVTRWTVARSRFRRCSATGRRHKAGRPLPEEGPAEWAVEHRERFRAEAVDVARELAEAAIAEGEPRIAVDACRVGLAIDRYHDPLWRLLIDARVAAGDVGAADRDRRDYAAILMELGVPAVASASS